MKKTVLRSYAKLLAQKGIHIAKGQGVRISAALDQPEFVAMLVEECYRAGASRVEVDWSYQPLTKLDVRHRTLKSLQTVEAWVEERSRHTAETLPCFIALISDDPDGLKGINTQKMAKARQARLLKLKPYQDAMEGRYQWCVAAVPGKGWAKKVFPHLRTSQAVEKLWQAILDCSRVTEGGDPIAAWEQHNADLKARCDYLNSLNAVELRYHSKNGTDFTVGLIPQGKFCGGEDKSLTGHTFNANIPTEEVFTSPKKGEAEGTLVSTMPLSYQGQLIDRFSIRFEKGKAVEWHAETGEEVLTHMLAMDENACYLGECALVPFNSSIRNSGVLFYNTLFDENAACHIALGSGYIDTLRDYDQYTLEECHELGINESMIHVDFMIGAEDLDIDAVDKDGNLLPIFRNGGWAF